MPPATSASAALWRSDAVQNATTASSCAVRSPPHVAVRARDQCPVARRRSTKAGAPAFSRQGERCVDERNSLGCAGRQNHCRSLARQSPLQLQPNARGCPLRRRPIPLSHRRQKAMRMGVVGHWPARCHRAASSKRGEERRKKRSHDALSDVLSPRTQKAPLSHMMMKMCIDLMIIRSCGTERPYVRYEGAMCARGWWNYIHCRAHRKVVMIAARKRDSSCERVILIQMRSRSSTEAQTAYEHGMYMLVLNSWYMGMYVHSSASWHCGTWQMDTWTYSYIRNVAWFSKPARALPSCGCLTVLIAHLHLINCCKSGEGRDRSCPSNCKQSGRPDAGELREETAATRQVKRRLFLPRSSDLSASWRLHDEAFRTRRLSQKARGQSSSVIGTTRARHQSSLSVQLVRGPERCSATSSPVCLHWEISDYPGEPARYEP